MDLSRRDAAYLFEVRHSSKLDNEALDKKLDDLQIDSINNLSNLISLCKLCHQYFDNPHYSIAIGLNHKLIVSKRIRDEVTQGGLPISTLHGKVVEFNGPPCRRPTPALLQYRLKYFESVSVNNRKNPRKIFESVSGSNRKRPRKEIKIRQNVNPQCSSEGVAPTTTSSRSSSSSSSSSAPATTGRTTRASAKAAAK